MFIFMWQFLVVYLTEVFGVCYAEYYCSTRPLHVCYDVFRVKSLPPSGHRWFEFNDAEVSCIYSQVIEKMFQGKKSAYMLFYRKRDLNRPQQGVYPLVCNP